MAFRLTSFPSSDRPLLVLSGNHPRRPKTDRKAPETVEANDGFTNLWRLLHVSSREMPGQVLSPVHQERKRTSKMTGILREVQTAELKILFPGRPQQEQNAPLQCLGLQWRLGSPYLLVANDRLRLIRGNE